MRPGTARKNSIKWTDAELATAVESYVFLLRLQQIGLTITEKAITQTLVVGVTKIRNEASIRYRMRNISAVSKELGGPILKPYSPAERVGTQVRQRLSELLGHHPGFQDLINKPFGADIEKPSLSTRREEALCHLNDLRTHLRDLERELVGIGHNHPPEPLHLEGPKREDFKRVYEDINGLEEELKRDFPSQRTVSKGSSGLVAFGLKVLKWLGERATKFTDVSLKITAPILVAKATNILPSLEAALSSVLHAIKH